MLKIYIPPIPEELRNLTVAFKILEDNLEELVIPGGDGNFGYYALFEAFDFLKKD